ncbi:tripartite motif-containing protein 72-like isoform X2 [Zootermopsis nevadensis]|uniref:tripartite motif-containing protein 72-like isoform X2 n=1 Tax=Zootermopsis nevadensis TaxID=136037 RepID=UPI000B8EE090|nr:tripartite motif-containing protein 72-like isoform X2 [Zootermopsis nevadensis]
MRQGLAQNQVSDMSKRSVDLIECGICMERFNQDDCKPKFLQCYHTYCSNCLTKIQKNNTVGGGVEFLCPSCQKLTRVGKKGVSALQDNFYVLPLSTSVKDRNDDIYMSDDGEEIDTTKAAGRVKNRLANVWCDTCLKVAGPECSVHVTCNLEDGKKRLKEDLESALKEASMELDREIKVRERQLTHLQAAHQAWKSGLVEHLEDQINAQSTALTVARSEVESLNCLKALQNEGDPSVIVSAIKDSKALVTSVHGRSKPTIKQATLLTALQICNIIIQPTLDGHDENKDKVQNWRMEVRTSDSNEEMALVYLMYRLLEKKGEETGTANGSWKLVDKPRKMIHVSKGRSSSAHSADHGNLVRTASYSTESLPSAFDTKIILSKSSYKLKKQLQCFFDIAIGGKLSGRIVIQLRPDVTPKMCANFVALCTGELGYGYKGSKIFKSRPDNYILGGDFENNDGSGGHSIYNQKSLFIADDCGLRDEKGAVRMKGMGTDERTGGGLVGSQFHIWVGDRDFKQFTRTLVIGKVTEGLELCTFISNLKTYRIDRGTFIRNGDVIIQDCGKL